jgi:hypothetical protein
LEPCHERIFHAQFIDPTATLGTVGQVGRDSSEFVVVQLTQRPGSQFLVGRMIHRDLGYANRARNVSKEDLL